MSMDFLKGLNEAKLHSRLHFEGLDISVEVPAGGYRRGTNKKTGEAWAHKIPDSYGYIKGTHSPDGEHLDCYLRKNPKKGAKVYVMHQMTVDGSRFDEDKVMLGYSTKAEAIRAFKDVTFKPGTMYGGCTEFDMDHFQLAAFSASNSTAMLTSQSNYEDFKKKGLLTKGIKSPLMIAKTISESLSEGLSEISESLTKGNLLECLEEGGLYEEVDVTSVLDTAWDHYSLTESMQSLGQLSEEQFKDRALRFMMETDAMLTDIEDEINESIIEDTGLDNLVLDDSVDLSEGDTAIEQDSEETVMETENNFVVVVHTQIMENIGSANSPSWATKGGKVFLIQEGFSTWGDARAVAAKVSSGQIPVELDEGCYVLGIDVMPTGEYRYLYESTVEEVEEVEETTEETFFQQQIMESQKLAGITPAVSYSKRSTPTIHETRAMLEAMNTEEPLEERAPMPRGDFTLSNGQLAHALRTSMRTLQANPHASVYQVFKAVSKKLYGDPTLDDELIRQADFEYGSLDKFEEVARRDQPEIVHGPRVLTKVEKR